MVKSSIRSCIETTHHDHLREICILSNEGSHSFWIALILRRVVVDRTWQETAVSVRSVCVFSPSPKKTIRDATDPSETIAVSVCPLLYQECPEAESSALRESFPSIDHESVVSPDKIEIENAGLTIFDVGNETTFYV